MKIINKLIMIPIRELINKIKWDNKEKEDAYSIGYFDRLKKKILFIRFNEIKNIDGGFMVLNREKETYIPLHRIRVVRKNGRVVWRRTN